MKKIVSILICVIMMGMISGCGDNTINDTNKPTDAFEGEQVSSSEIESTKEEPTEPSTEKETEAPINNEYEIGKTIKFGRYEQDNDFSNGKEPIRWEVLDIVDEKALVVSLGALDCQPYHLEAGGVTWETSYIRKWLNSTFIETAFSDEENNRIPTVVVLAEKNPDYDTDTGNSTEDKVFLLSIQEVDKYFKTDRERQCYLTQYAISQGVEMIAFGSGHWWLRSPGNYCERVATVSYNGYLYTHGLYAIDDFLAVRPAMWIDINT